MDGGEIVDGTAHFRLVDDGFDVVLVFGGACLWRTDSLSSTSTYFRSSSFGEVKCTTAKFSRLGLARRNKEGLVQRWWDSRITKSNHVNSILLTL